MKDFMIPFKTILASIFVLGFFAVLFNFSMFSNLEGPIVSVFNTIVGALTACLTMIISYHFGSSSGSKEKTEILNRVVNHNND